MPIIVSCIWRNFLRVIKLRNLFTPFDIWRHDFDPGGSGIKEAISALGLIVGGSWRYFNRPYSFVGSEWREEHIRSISAKAEIIADVAARSKIGRVFPMLLELVVLETQGSPQRLPALFTM